MVREVVTGFLVFLQGTWVETIDANKFNKFFTASAIKRAVDAWWDAKDRCVVTQADANMADTIENDMDLFFPEEVIAIDLTNLDQETAVTKGLLSTGLVSTFQTKGIELHSGTKAAPKDVATVAEQLAKKTQSVKKLKNRNQNLTVLWCESSKQ